MMRLMQRLAREIRTRGAWGFLRFVASRVAQRRSDVLYDMDLSALHAQDCDSDILVAVNCNTLGSHGTGAVESAVLIEANHAYREALRGDAQLFALVDSDHQVMSYGFVLFASFYKNVLGETRDTPMISNCYTFPAHRGQGLYPRLLLAISHSLASQGFKRAIVTCAPDNQAAVRGIEKARFNHVKTVDSTIVLTRWIAWQKSTPASGGGG
jgi:GNAT superfamily N-acetyltransferase